MANRRIAMKKDQIFLAEDGKLTMSSAAHLRDLAAAKAQDILAGLNDVEFVNQHMTLIATQQQYRTRVGWTDDQLRQVSSALKRVAEYHSFEAWMNEAIEAKRRLLNDIQRMSIEDSPIEVPKAPEKTAEYTTDDYMSTLSIKDRNLFYSLETKVAVIGKFIHKDSPYARAVKRMQECLNRPVQAEVNGRDTMVYEYALSADKALIDDVYFQLQQEHRESQAQLNGMRNTMNETIRKENLAHEQEYKAAYEAYHNAMTIARSDFNTWQKLELARIEKLKIVIPVHLQDVYDELCKLGK